MKNKVMVLLLAGILTIGGISVAFAAGRNDTTFNRPMMDTQKSDNKSTSNYRMTMMGEQNASFNSMIKIMKDNGFIDKAKAMENRDFDSMNNLMNNINDADYNKMIDIMRQNGYGSMANMMESVNTEDMAGFHKSMMGR